MLSNVNFIALEVSISKERLSRYRTENSDISKAISLYERNTLLAEAFYTSLQGLEICFRNKLHAALQLTYDNDWLLHERVPLAVEGRRHIADAKDVLRSPRRLMTEGAIIAELSLGFWVGLIGPSYDSTLWRKALYRVFSANGRYLRRKDVHGRFNAIRRFRNRVAHHEPIWDQDLLSRHREIIEAIGWMCADTAQWVDRRSRLPGVVLDQ